MSEGLQECDRHAKAKVYCVVAVCGFGSVFLWLRLVADYAVADTLLMAVLLVGLPFLSIVQVPLVSGLSIDRMRAYWSSIVTLWILGVTCWLVGTRGGDVSAIGIVPLSASAMLGWSITLTLAGMGIILCFRWITDRFSLTETRLLKNLLPKTYQERRVFVVLSFAAGTCEELAYRGYAISMLAPVMGLSGAAAASALVFGLMHGYQGRLGVFRTTLMGLVFAWGFIASGSLLPAMIAHTTIDLIAGIVLGDWLLSPEPDFGIDSKESPLF